MNLNKLFTLLFALVSSFFVACSDSDKTAGGTTEDAGIIADLNVAGLTQKGPFAKGSVVTVQGIDCKTLKFTDEKFEGKVKSDKGDFDVEDVNLSATCALFEVTGYYFNELTGKKSSEKMTLHALTDLKDRKNVNINLLTQLEYERVMNLVTKKDKSFADAKKQAEKEVLAAFNVKVKDGEFAQFEDLNILEKGDDNAALLAVSVLMQSDLKVEKLTERVNDVAADIAKDGLWDDDKTKTEIAEWAATADKNGELVNVGKNIEKWGGSDDVSSFETVVEKFADSKKGTSSSSVTSAGSVTLSSSSSKNVLSSSSSSVIASEAKQSSSEKSSSSENSESTEGTMTDARDGQIYKIVTINSVTWMAQNLNYKSENSFCYNDSSKYCDKYGRLYTWAAAIDSAATWSESGKGCGWSVDSCGVKDPARGVCPLGWHIPTKEEWLHLFLAANGKAKAGQMLKADSLWEDFKGSDDFGFAILPGGGKFDGTEFDRIGKAAYFWCSDDWINLSAQMMMMSYFDNSADFTPQYKFYALSVRCVKDDGKTALTSSSSFAEPSSSVASSGSISSSSVNSSSSVAVATPCKTNTEDNCDYGTLTDSRDGQVYKTVKIGDQIWMAENLNFAYTSVPYKYEDNVSDSTSWCYDNDPANCTNYGRLYTWAAAMDSAGLISVANKTKCGYGITCTPNLIHQGICPGGWHIPTVAEWKELFVNVGGTCNDEEYSCTNSGAILKSSSGWYDSGNGSDDFGFSVIPSGWYKVNSSDNISLGNIAYFWTAMEYDSSRAYVWFFIFSQSNAKQDASKKMSGHSVRCLKD